MAVLRHLPSTSPQRRPLSLSPSLRPARNANAHSHSHLVSLSLGSLPPTPPSLSLSSITKNYIRSSPSFLHLAPCGASAHDLTPPPSMDHASFIHRVGELLSLGFPLWVASACALALWRPSSFLWVSPTAQMIGITLTMLGMGMTLTLQDLQSALLLPKELAAGFLLQYTVMPMSGFFISKLLNLPAHYAAGLILVSCCPGGTASNIVTYLAKGNVALSVLMTAASTSAAAVMTPFLTSKLAGQFVPVDPTALFISTAQVVLAPVLAGALLNQYCKAFVQLLSPLMPFVAVATVAILCGNAIAQNAAAILSSGSLLVLAVCCLHGCGFFFGYVLARMLGIDVSSSRTISIEVGMQNSVLGVVLATKHFGNPLTAVPCAVSSICHSVYGSILAGIWRCMPPIKKKD